MRKTLPFFAKKNPMEKLQSNLSQLQLRLAALTDKRSATQAARADAITARDRHLVEGDIADEATAAKLQAKVDHYNSALAGLDAALGTLQTQVAEAEQQITDAEQQGLRRAASEKLAADLGAFEKALPIYQHAARQLAEAAEAFYFHYETSQPGIAARSWAAQIDIAGALSLQELGGWVEQIKTGARPIPAPKPELAPPVPPAVTPEEPHFAYHTLKGGPVYRGQTTFERIDRSAENREVMTSGPRF